MAGRGIEQFTSWATKARNLRGITVVRMADGVPNTDKKASWNQWFFGTVAVVVSIVVKKLSALGVG